MRFLSIIGICFLSLIYSVNSFSNTPEARVLLTPQDALSQHAICWYEDKRYSEGAIINMANVRLICTVKNPNHNNSPLSWLMLNDKNEVIYPPRAKTIRVN
ncbi:MULTISPECIES: DUF1496 domain-containing protein [unclassified Pseudoalteromonas]|uniref:DUF1496 domain-containing protein n=1 Tax=unclassified Pseudoalteromonas TaxID=194690 RepID=UPI000B3C34ED|nr:MULTISPECIES: DUF1496 domain-containing protein [unclassified Pseudoalteromonas]MDN3380357.1 DUF1496 domain-containing protein [Pseudoalteromonas sp. APC 3893]MDN3388690.1 DUF1496 domain-containing protein [Pseudoalteromonas sp. APC 4017]OUS70742.1 hypothetical protein B5G52_13900 [Pseudoalteromonas sp. A601]